MYNFMCEYTGTASDIIVNSKLLKRGFKTMLSNVPREDFLNILKAQENGWLKIHGNVSFDYSNTSLAIELYEKLQDGEEKEIVLNHLKRLAKENTNTFDKNNSVEKFVEKFKKVEEPKVEEPKAEEPKVEEPKVEEPKVEEPKVEEPKVEEPEAEEPKVEEPEAEEPKKAKTTRKAKKS